MMSLNTQCYIVSGLIVRKEDRATELPEEHITRMIIQKLLDTQENYDVKIPLAVESGSRGWGFASPDSDYDCRFVYIHEKDWYLSVFDKPDIIEYAAGKVFDINGWDLKKFIAHTVKSNAVMLEWLSSNEVYLKNEPIALLLSELGKQFFNPVSVSHHYLSMAVKKYTEIISADKSKLKNYFYVMRPLANIRFIENYGKMPYMEYSRTLAEIDIDEDIRNEINRITEIKKHSDESYTIARNELLLGYLDDEIKRQNERLPDVSFKKNRNYEQADTIFKNILEMVWNDG